MATTQPGGLYKVGGVLVDAEGKETKRRKGEVAPSEGDLAEDFPGRDDLVAAGLTTRDAVAARSDAELEALDGIGPATVKKIRDALT